LNDTRNPGKNMQLRALLSCVWKVTRCLVTYIIISTRNKKLDFCPMPSVGNSTVCQVVRKGKERLK
jgi:hypothetical protein